MQISKSMLFPAIIAGFDIRRHGRMLRLLTLGFLVLSSCVQDRHEPTYPSSESSVPLSVIISNQCAVLRLSIGYIALFIVKDSPTIYYGAYFSEKSSFDWQRPTVDGIVEGNGVITVQGAKIHLRSVGEFEAEVALIDAGDVTAGIAVGQGGWGVGDVDADQLSYRANHVLKTK
ncbi:hypothetical protein OAM01_02095 [bacterium]|nr:hypothetical protein [bacterium]